LLIAYALIGLTILFTVTGQLLIKSATLSLGAIPTQFDQLLPFILRAYLNWKVLGGLACAVIASVCWLGAVSRSNISFAYPFMGFAIVLVLVLSPLLFGETVPWSRWVGVIVVCVGIWIAAQQ
jgi:multidrug transporter EmrE-like cation transporter